MVTLTFVTAETSSLRDVADDIARKLAFAKTSGANVFVQTPVLFPSGRCVGVKLLGGPEIFTVTDDGSAMREGELIGAEDICRREARKEAREYDLKFNEWELFEGSAPAELLVGMTSLVANAAALTMVRTTDKFVEQFGQRRKEELSVRLSRIFGERNVTKDAEYNGAARTWSFDAKVDLPSGRAGLFALVTPAPISVAFAYSKIDDVSRVDPPPFLGAVLEGRFDPGDKALLGRAARRLFLADGSDDQFRLAA